MRAALTVPVEEVREGDFIPALDNGYVVEVDEDPSDLTTTSAGRMSVRFAEGLVLVTFHSAEGDENYLLVTPGTPISIERYEA